ncbi:hypothetical protein Hanom_Chr04g00296111 [Helianthus anomalus]
MESTQNSNFDPGKDLVSISAGFFSVSIQTTFKALEFIISLMKYCFTFMCFVLS